MDISDKEVIKIMVDGGEKLCDHAIEQWEGYKYGHDYDLRQGNLLRWKTIKSRIRGIAKEIKEETCK